MSDSITPSPAFVRRRQPSSSGTSYGVPSPPPFGLRALTSPPNPKRQALQEVSEQRRILSGSSASAFFVPNSGGMSRHESGAFSSHRLGNFLPSYRSLGGEYLAERCGTSPEGVYRAVREGNASITLLDGGGRAVVSIPGGLIIWEVCAWGDSDAEGSLAPIFHISHPGLDTPVNARNVKLASCGTTLLAASPNAHIRVWKDPKSFPRSSSDFSLPLARDAGGSKDDHTISSVIPLSDEDFLIGSSQGEIWRFFPSISNARKLQWSVNEKRISSPVGFLSRFMGLNSNPTFQESENCSATTLGGEVKDRVVTMLVLNLVNDQHLLLVFMKKGGIYAWNVNANEEVPKWSYSPPDSQWNGGSVVLDAKLIGCHDEGEVLMLCATTPEAASFVERSEGESSRSRRPHKLFLNHIRVATTCDIHQHQGQKVSILHHMPIDRFCYSCDTGDDSTNTFPLVIEPLGGSSSKSFMRAHFWGLNCPDGDVTVTTVDFASKDGRHIMNSHDYRTTKYVLPSSILHYCIGGGLRPPFGPGILLFNEKGSMIAVSRLGDDDGITIQQDRKKERLITTKSPDLYEIGGPCISVEMHNMPPSSDLGREWAVLLETAYLVYERNGDALTPLQPILEGDPLGKGQCALVEAVRDVSGALLNSEPILPPNSAIDEAVHIPTVRSPNISTNNGSEAGIGREGEGGGGAINTTVLVHDALAVKAKRHRSFVGFIRSTMLWSAIRLGQAASIMASHGEQLSAAIVLCGAQGRVSQLLHLLSLAHLFCNAEALALKARGIDIEALRNAGVTPTLAFFTKVSNIMDLFLHIEDLPEFDPLLVDISEVLVAMLDAAVAHRLQYGSMYEAGIAARPWTSERMVRGVIVQQLQLHASSLGTSKGKGGRGEDTSIVWDPKLSGVVLRLASVLLGGFQEQEEKMGRFPPAGREQQQWKDSYNAAKKVAMAAVRMACQPADSWNLALEHECFESLLRIAIQAEDQQPGYTEGLNALRRLMKNPPGGPKGGFQEFLLSSLLSDGREADVLELGAAAAPELLQDILSSSGESKLSWMNWVMCDRFTEAAGRLLNLAKLESNSLSEKHTLLSLAKLSHLSAGGPSLVEKGESEMLPAEIDDALCITASQKLTLGGDEVDAHVKEWEGVVHQCIDQVVMLHDENRSRTKGALLAANAGLSVVDAQHRLGVRSKKMNNTYLEKLLSAAARIWEVIIKQSLDQPEVKSVLSRLASDSIVSDQEIESMWKTGGSLLHLTLSSIYNNTKDAIAIDVTNNNPSQLTDDMIWNSLALAYPDLKMPTAQHFFNLIGKAR